MKFQEDIEKFKISFNENIPIYESWGSYISSMILERLKQKKIVLQIHSYRLKTLDSAVEKIYRKNYSNPLQDMTDFVGIRFVTLLSRDIPIISKEIESVSEWVFSKDRDFEEEKKRNPDKFGYQSNHYIIRSREDIINGSIVIPSGTCCEVQVRDLLQHAFAEVAHDSIYKSNWEHPHKIHRFAANSAALMETADFLLCETMTLIDKDNAGRSNYLNELAIIYNEKIGNTGSPFNQKFNENILKEFGQFINENILLDTKEFWEGKEAIFKKIKRRIKSNSTNILWEQPIILVLYLLVYKYGDKVIDLWPYGSSRDELNKIYVDLGFTYESRL